MIMMRLLVLCLTGAAQSRRVYTASDTRQLQAHWRDEASNSMKALTQLLTSSNTAAGWQFTGHSGSPFVHNPSGAEQSKILLTTGVGRSLHVRPYHRGCMIQLNEASLGKVKVEEVKGVFSLPALNEAAQVIADAFADENATQSGALTALFQPAVFPNPFAPTRWEPRVFVARDEQGAIIAVIQTCLANIALNEPDGSEGSLQTARFFQNIVVVDKWRRKGVGTRLLDFALAADERCNELLAVDPENEPAVELYRKRGFEIYEAEPEKSGQRLMFRNRFEQSA